MEANHEELPQPSNYQEGENNEIRIMMPLVEENTRSKLYQASKIGSIQTLKTFIREDPNILRNVLIFSSSTENPLHLSVLHGHLEFTRLLLDHNPELVVEVNGLHQTPLHLASVNGNLEIVRALLEKNSSACLVRDLNGLIPLHHAVIRGHIEIMKELIHARPRSVWTKLNNGQTVLHLCVKDNHLEAIKLLTEIFLYHDKDFLNTTDNTRSTILDMSLKLRRIEMLEYLHSIPNVRSGKITTADLEAPNITKRSRKSSIQQTKNTKRRRRESNKTSRRWQTWKKTLKYKGDWLQEVQGTLMLVATVIATVTFQGAIDPPGGVWQQDMLTNSCWKKGKEMEAQAGIAIMACKSLQIYKFYLMANSISFLASVSVILLIVSGFPLRNRIFGGLLTLAMCVAVACLTFAYVYGTAMVSGNQTTQNYLLILLRVWYGMVGMVILCCIIIPFFIWVVKKFISIFNFSKVPATSNTQPLG